MKFEDTLTILRENANEVVKQIEICQNEEKLRNIDLDVLLEKIRNIYDIVLDIRQLTDKYTNQSEIPVDTQKEKEIVDSLDAQNIGDPDSGHDYERTETEGHKVIESVQAEKDNKEASVSKSGKKVQEEKRAYISDKYKSDERTLNDEIARSSGSGGLGDKLSANPIQSITAALGLNEKFELINELFDGNKQLFDRTLEVLNAADDFNEAVAYLDQQFNWDMENPYVVRLLGLLKRKLSR